MQFYVYCHKHILHAAELNVMIEEIYIYCISLKSDIQDFQSSRQYLYKLPYLFSFNYRTYKSQITYEIPNTSQKIKISNI